MEISDFETFNRNEAKPVSEDLHNEMMKTMSAFSDNGKPKVGIFWYNYTDNTLFGVEKGDADLYISDTTPQTYPKLHKTYWQKKHQRAIAKNETDSIFYKEHNYTLIPRGRVFVRPDGTFYVMVGDWFNGVINGKRVFDKDKFRELICDEFNLPEDFEFMEDEHWNIGRGWSEDKF